MGRKNPTAKQKAARAKFAARMRGKSAVGTKKVRGTPKKKG